MEEFINKALQEEIKNWLDVELQLDPEGIKGKISAYYGCAPQFIKEVRQLGSVDAGILSNSDLAKHYKSLRDQ